MSKEESLFEAMGGTYRSVDGILYPDISFLQEVNEEAYAMLDTIMNHDIRN